VFAFASSAGVYGPRNPHRCPDRITPDTAVSPVECYGVDKIDAERLLAGSGLPHVVLRLAGVASPEPPSGPDYLVLMRAIPRDNRVHMVDARDVALAFANAVDRIDAVDGMTLLVGGDDSHALTHSVVQDDMFEAFGLGRVGAEINLPGNPDDDRGWSFTDWFDTTRSQQLLEYQEHSWGDTLAWVRDRLGPRRQVLRAVGPLARPMLRAALGLQRRREGRGPWADPWALIAQVYGEDVLVPAAAVHTP
jgi:nucleoside-diphosphate-sugar epimerase